MIDYVKNIPDGKLPIYFCSIEIKIKNKNRSKVSFYTKSFEKVVLKGRNENELKELVLKRKHKFLVNTEIKNSVQILDVKIKLIDQLGFGIVE